MNPYQELANAIIVLAVKDYRIALRKCAARPHDRAYQSERKELEAFFQSGWFGVLTDLDGELLMQKIQEEVFGKAAVA